MLWSMLIRLLTCIQFYKSLYIKMFLLFFLYAWPNHIITNILLIHKSVFSLKSSEIYSFIHSTVINCNKLPLTCQPVTIQQKSISKPTPLHNPSQTCSCCVDINPTFMIKTWQANWAYLKDVSSRLKDI